ncbi:MAG: stage 0 sporulation family protein [Eubacteriales bacterium]|nr:stage 0 sporulation family protein [Eubacteriales bacterium]
MVDVAGVRFRAAGKTYYFDPCGMTLPKGTGVIVETARGLEFGTVSMENQQMDEKDVVSPLKKVVRIANADDLARHKENESKKNDAMRICREKIKQHGLDMKLIDVEYTFDNNKVIFYFTADGRVDFRDLVRDLAGQFKMRIELRQVGVRDEAKMLGGIGCCGRPICCAFWMKNFQPVSIKMTKIQNLSLNPAKISGVCGRLMCCLKYENDVYIELRKDLPNVNERVKTEEGVGKVIENNVLAGTVKVRTFTGERDENGREKLSSEVYSFHKSEVERLKIKGMPGKPSGEHDEKTGKGSPQRKERPHGHRKNREHRKNAPDESSASAGTFGAEDAVSGDGKN